MARLLPRFEFSTQTKRLTSQLAAQSACASNAARKAPLVCRSIWNRQRCSASKRRTRDENSGFIQQCPHPSLADLRFAGTSPRHVGKGKSMKLRGRTERIYYKLFMPIHTVRHRATLAHSPPIGLDFARVRSFPDSFHQNLSGYASDHKCLGACNLKAGKWATHSRIAWIRLVVLLQRGRDEMRKTRLCERRTPLAGTAAGAFPQSGAAGAITGKVTQVLGANQGRHP